MSAGGGRGSEGSESAVPRAALESLRASLAHTEDLSADLLRFFSMADPDALAELPPLHRARTFLVLAKAASSLFSVRLRCAGIDPDDHPIRKELERLSLNEEKLERFEDWSKAPLRPSTTLNSQAAARFIGHSLPHLTPEQRKSIQALGRGNGVMGRSSEIRSRKKRRHQQSEIQSVRVAAKEFLEKATRELLKSTDRDVKGLVGIVSEEEDD